MTIDEKYYNIGLLDQLSFQNTFVHRLDPRVKLIVSLFFLFTVISFPKYEVAALFPFLLYPMLLMSLGEIPFRFVFKKVLLVSPFAIFIGIFNPFLDSTQVAVLPGLTVSAGWFSLSSILLKFILTVSVAILLIATTSFPAVCHALRQIGIPSLFVSQLLFLYRYLFVLVEEAIRIVRARDMRSYGHKGSGVKVFVRIVGVLFLRTIERAERIYFAMLARGFHGDMPTGKQYHIAPRDLVFTASAVIYLCIFRFYPVAEIIGRHFQELFL
jgi:cobalt/nickel transport system permease protein